MQNYARGDQSDDTGRQVTLELIDVDRRIQQ